MTALSIVRETSSDQYEKILFERPISSLQSRKIAILVGEHAQIKYINDIYQIILALKHQPIIIAERTTSSTLVPVDTYMEKSRLKSKPLYSNADEVISSVNNCSYAVVGVDFEINSTLQLFLEKLIVSRPSPILFNDESMVISRVSPDIFLHRVGDTYICSIVSLSKFANNLGVANKVTESSGVLQKLQFMSELSSITNANIVVLADRQILATSSKQTNQGYISNFNIRKKTDLRGVVTAILVSLLTDSSSTQDDFLMRVATTSYLLRQGFKRNDIITTLKKIA